MLKGSEFVAAAAFLTLSVPAQAHLQCVPYARSISGIDIYGDARTWWDQAEDLYPRGNQPEINSVLVFEPTAVMPLGHVAVVADIIDERHILLNHANWSRPGMIERGVLAVDISAAGDWSAVRVWYGRTETLGARSNPTYGFIYSNQRDARNAGAIVSADPAPSEQEGNRLQVQGG